jgi:hypothetical protein
VTFAACLFNFLPTIRCESSTGDDISAVCVCVWSALWIQGGRAIVRPPAMRCARAWVTSTCAVCARSGSLQ